MTNYCKSGWKTGVSVCLCEKKQFENIYLPYHDSIIDSRLTRCCPEGQVNMVTQTRSTDKDLILQCEEDKRPELNSSLQCTNNGEGSNKFKIEELYHDRKGVKNEKAKDRF